MKTHKYTSVFCTTVLRDYICMYICTCMYVYTMNVYTLKDY